MSITAFIPVIGSIIDRIFPDKTKAEAAKAELAVLEATGELQLMLGQLETNKEEATHKSIFVAGWRPFIGWVCGSAFAYHFLLYPIIITTASLTGLDVSKLPEFDIGSLLTVLGGMLGLGGLRTFERVKGVERNSLNGQ